MCFGFKRSSAKGDAPNGTSSLSSSDIEKPARKISSPQPVEGEKGGEKPTKKEKKKWNDDEYGDSVSLALHRKTQQRIKELYPDGPPEDVEGMGRSQMSGGMVGGPMGGGAGMAMGL
ncbi:hypothetical protein V492_04801 [Pseudogymnoascus sp. VKM F-4246]|nr:hypothetical protein V492_04801 [Pseudogymnoascus sp. VKM F-4246]